MTTDAAIRCGTRRRHGIRWIGTWPHISLGISAHLGGKFAHLSIHLPIGVLIIGFIGEAS